MSNPVFNIANLGAYTPAETIELVSRAGTIKGNMRPHKVFLSAVSAGCILSFACAAVLCTLTAPWLQANAPGLIRTIGALIFPFGFVLIVLTGADLFTGSNMFTAVAVLHGRLSIWKMLLHWFLCFWGNLAGSLFVTFIIFAYGGVFNAPAFHNEVIAFVTSKQLTPEWHEIFLRGIGCNWLVGLAVFLAMQGKDLNSKVVGMWWPVFAFVALGLDHVVANMCFIPLGIHLGTPGVTVPLYIWKGIIPVGLGNIVGGGLFCGAYYWYMYLLDQPEIAIDGATFQSAGSTPVLYGLRKRQADLESSGNSESGKEDGRLAGGVVGS